MHLSLARKYRPKTFASVAVQSHVSNTLQGAIARGRVAHGYLLCGPRGVGKTTLARVLAMALNCERRTTAVKSGQEPSGEPCGECASCTRIWSGSASLDVVEIDAASNRGVDDARELRERAMYAPSTAEHYKVYIVDEAHMLTREAWNALLKILEEPPPRVVFVFATTEPQKIAQSAAPVLSRLQRFDLKRMSPADVRVRLTEVLAAEKVEAEPEALAMLSRAADGSMRDALSLADQALALGDGTLTATRVREALGLVPEDEYVRLFDLITEGRAGEIFPAIAHLADEGADFGVFLAGFSDLLRGQLAATLGGDLPELSDHLRAALRERAGRLSAGDLLRMLGSLVELESQFRKSGQQRLLLEALLVRFALMDRTVSLEEVLRSMGGGGGGEKGAARERPRTPAPSPSAVRGSAPAGERKAAPPPAADLARGTAGSRGSGERGGRSAAEAPPLDPASAPWAGNESPQMSAGGTAVIEARAPSTSEASEPVEVNRLAERWGEVVTAVRENGRAILATALEHAAPVAVTARGDVTIELEDEMAMYADVIESGAADVCAAVATLFSGVARIRLRPPAAATAAPPQRLTEAAVKGDRLARLCRRDPSLATAVNMLDLELID
jgi:DNA polymerase III subunit gamma/tau